MEGVARDVVVHVRWDDDRTMHLSAVTDDGAVGIGSTDRSDAVGRLAREGVAALLGPDAATAVLLVDRPPWLHEGDRVRIDASALESGETHRYGRVVGFLPIGGVMVVHPESGAGIYPPELLEPQ